MMDAEHFAAKLDKIAKEAAAHARSIGTREASQALNGVAGAIEAQADILRMTAFLLDPKAVVLAELRRLASEVYDNDETGREAFHRIERRADDLEHEAKTS